MKGVRQTHWTDNVIGNCFGCNREFESLRSARKHTRDTGHDTHCEVTTDYSFQKENQNDQQN
jgi:hypothetical protein